MRPIADVSTVYFRFCIPIHLNGKNHDMVKTNFGCLLCNSAKERKVLEYRLTTQKKELSKIFLMISCFFIFAPWVRRKSYLMLRLIFFGMVICISRVVAKKPRRLERDP